MRVLTVARWYPSHDSPGRGSFVADLVEATVRAGVDARVVSFDRVLVRGALDQRERVLREARAAYERVALPDALFVVPSSRGAPGVPVARLPVVRRPGADDVGELLEDHATALRPFLARLVGEWRPDVIHAHTGLPDGVVAADLGAELGIPVVVSEHMSTIEAELDDPVALERYRGLLRPGVTLLAVSPPLAHRIAGVLGVAAARIGVLPNPVAIDASAPHTREEHRSELLWVGSLGEHKGIDVLLRAFAEIRAAGLGGPDLRLRLIGGERAAGDRARWDTLAAELGLTDAVAFDGWADRATVAEAMRRARLFVHPSPSETFGVAAAEAILCGLPVAARRSGGVPWIIEQSGGFGSVAEDDSVTGFARAIGVALGGELPVDPVTARERLTQAVGAAAVGERTIALYREVAHGSASPLETEGTRRPRPAPLLLTERPTLLVASGWDQAWRLVADLPDKLRDGLTIVLPARPQSAVEQPHGRWVEAAPVPPPTRPPSGRSPITRVRRLLYQPPPTGDDLLRRALEGTARGVPGRRPVPVVALDAPAAVVADTAGTVTLAPGTLRWLADRWDADRGDEAAPGTPARDAG